MEFNEKLKELRKSKGLTQEELAEALFVSRTAISKWESGKGYPSIDSLKDISKYFSVTIDDLLSGEKLIFIAEKENKDNIQNICDLIFGIIDVCSFLLIVLPLYPNKVKGYILSVNLIEYIDISMVNKVIYWFLIMSLIILGGLKLLFRKINQEDICRKVTNISIVISVFTVLFLAITREVYAVIVVFLLFLAKGMLLFQTVKYSR